MKNEARDGIKTSDFIGQTIWWENYSKMRTETFIEKERRKKRKKEAITRTSWG